MGNSTTGVLPLVIIGAGPVGLAAAAQALKRGIDPVVLEASGGIAATFADTAHVRLFSPWRYDIDQAARELLLETGWTDPDPEQLPTAGELRDTYLLPLSKIPRIAAGLRFGQKVTHITRAGADKVKTKGRNEMSFLIRIHSAEGDSELRANAVIDTSGTWNQPNPMGGNGIPAQGEERFAPRISFGMPDILGSQRGRFAGKKVAVVGSGHSASGNLISLAELAAEAPGTSIVWIVRGADLSRTFGGGDADGLPARGELGARLKALLDSGVLDQRSGFLVSGLSESRGRIVIAAEDGRTIENVDEIIVSTGSRPDLSIARELRLKLDPWLESTESLAPLIDPNVHSCGTVPPHGHRELSHPEANFYVAGSKSYGRAPNFLLATGYEQVRSIVAQLAGDKQAADDVRLVLPETGVCSSGTVDGSACCGGPAPANADACCALDAEAKTAGEAGCGCGTPAKVHRFEKLETIRLA